MLDEKNQYWLCISLDNYKCCEIALFFKKEIMDQEDPIELKEDFEKKQSTSKSVAVDRAINRTQKVADRPC